MKCQQFHDNDEKVQEDGSGDDEEASNNNNDNNNNVMKQPVVHVLMHLFHTGSSAATKCWIDCCIAWLLPLRLLDRVPQGVLRHDVVLKNTTRTTRICWNFVKTTIKNN
jgi:hypothetical protein